ncbi:Putative peptidoglycan binding domain-containing protein [Rosenbergiella nectarea]|uniref:Peptidoglycan binding domain-containing protein n=1 Tax=Rosenbergiella nectarea TaxID=988801 RepID=A0A1H9MQL3_9GAMM|nr:peptidoglycan-binding protein [Rosenbergiella nectarea]SER25705.1 Putative peptidoglycan binding domain-containing protein [Rosenbergiella nectarea]
MLYQEPRIYRLKGTVGNCGTNNPNDVKAIQKMIIGAGYPLSTGRTLSVDGVCSSQTNEAIIWYQRLLTLSPTGLIHPTDSFFIYAMENAYSPGRRPQQTSGSLRVSEGQITFDAKGLDYITAVVPFRQQHYPSFSRILHWPSTFSSGVTLGRGYDMGNRTSGEIFSTLRQAGIEEYKAVICSKASHLKGRQAEQFIKIYGYLIGEITHTQQITLFNIVYREKLNYAQGVYLRNSRHVANAPTWYQIDKEIRDVFVDTLYQGNRSAPEMVRIIARGGSRNDIISYLKNDPMLSRDQRRNDIRIRSLSK